jgi:hypothetical protein
MPGISWLALPGTSVGDPDDAGGVTPSDFSFSWPQPPTPKATPMANAASACVVLVTIPPPLVFPLGPPANLPRFRPGMLPPFGRMVHARLTCSDEKCTEVYEAYGPLEEIAVLACECGCGLEIIGWPDPVASNGAAESVELVPVLS